MDQFILCFRLITMNRNISKFGVSFIESQQDLTCTQLPLMLRGKAAMSWIKFDSDKDSGIN